MILAPLSIALALVGWTDVAVSPSRGDKPHSSIQRIARRKVAGNSLQIGLGLFKSDRRLQATNGFEASVSASGLIPHAREGVLCLSGSSKVGLEHH